MKRPGPPRRLGSNGTSPGDPDAAIAAARDALVLAEAEVARVSRDRLAQLLGQSVRQRFRHFDDPDLVPADRVRLRASVIEPGRLRSRLWGSTASIAESVVSRLLRRPRTIVAGMALCIVSPAALHAVTVHDGDQATVVRITRVTIKNPDGTTAIGAYGPGVRLVVFGDGPSLQAREWKGAAGYETYAVDACDVVVEHRSPWQALTGFALAVQAGWSRPAGSS